MSSYDIHGFNIYAEGSINKILESEYGWAKVNECDSYDLFIKKCLTKDNLPTTPHGQKKGFNKLINPLSDDFSMKTPPLPNMPQPKVQMASNISPTTGLTQTQEALLSPSEQVIAKRNRTV